jgi:hypothetical protein
VKEALWFRKLASDIGMKMDTVTILCNNQRAVKLLRHPIASQRSKHIDVLHHFARERVARKCWNELKTFQLNCERCK